MTKPITSLAAMMLWEQGGFDLNDPVEAYIPSFRDGRVYTGGTTKDIETTPVHQPVQIWNLLSHTSGLSSTIRARGRSRGHRLLRLRGA